MRKGDPGGRTPVDKLFRGLHSLLPLSSGVVQGQDWAASESGCLFPLSEIRLHPSLHLDLQLKRSVAFVQHL